MRNNYDQSSSGINIKVKVAYDIHMSQENFNENIEHLRGDTYLYIDYGNITPVLDNKDLFEISDKHRKGIYVKALIEYCGYLEVSGMNKQGCIDALYDEFSLETMADFVEMLESYNIDYTRKFDRYVTRGYSQGDSAEVFIPHELYKVWGMSEDKDLVEVLSQDIDNYFWDAPMSVWVDVNDERYYSEKYDGRYNNWNTEQQFDKDLFIQEVCEYFKDDVDVTILHSELENLVPDEVEWKN